MQAALVEIEALLRSYGHTYEANLAGIALARFANDPAATCRAVNSAEWWGDGHSLAAIDLAVSGGFTPAARRDAQRLRRALIEVFTTLRAYGETNAAAEILVMQFDKWNQSNV